MLKRFALFLMLAAIPAAAQGVTVPPASTSSVVLSWAASISCSVTAPCTYAVYRVPGTVTIGAGTAGATLVTTTSLQVLTATDATVVPGSTYSYAVEALQAGTNSAPSNTVTLTIPLAPAAPTGLTGTP